MNNPNTPTPDSAGQIKAYTDCIFKPSDIVEIRLLPSGQSLWCGAGDLLRKVNILKEKNRQNQNIYIGANPRKAPGGSKRQDVALSRCLFADFDHIDWKEAQRRMKRAQLPESTLALNSGHGIHAYWRLTDSIKDLDRWTQLQKALIAAVDSDRSIHDPPRIMRLPGFLNHKPPPAECAIIRADPDQRYDIELLASFLAQGKSTAQNAHNTQKYSDDTSESYHRAVAYAAKWQGEAEGGRNLAAFRLAANLTKDFALESGQAWEILAGWNQRNSPPLGEDELRKVLENAQDYGSHPSGLKTACLAGDVRTVEPNAWEPPIPLGQFDLPLFPQQGFPDSLAELRDYCLAVAESFQVSLDLPAMLVLAAASAALAKKIEVAVAGEHIEPVNLYTVVALEPANRKTGVFGKVYKPLSDYERQQTELALPLVQQNQHERDILEGRIRHLKGQLSKAKANERRSLQTELEATICELEQTPHLYDPPISGRRHYTRTAVHAVV